MTTRSHGLVCEASPSKRFSKLRLLGISWCFTHEKEIMCDGHFVGELIDNSEVHNNAMPLVLLPQPRLRMDHEEVQESSGRKVAKIE